MFKAYLWKTKFPALEPLPERASIKSELYNFIIYKNGESVVHKFGTDIDFFIREILNAVDEKEIYLHTEHIIWEPPPGLISSEELEHQLLTKKDKENIFNAWHQL